MAFEPPNSFCRSAGATQRRDACHGPTPEGFCIGGVIRGPAPSAAVWPWGCAAINVFCALLLRLSASQPRPSHPPWRLSIATGCGVAARAPSSAACGPRGRARRLTGPRGAGGSAGEKRSFCCLWRLRRTAPRAFCTMYSGRTPT